MLSINPKTEKAKGFSDPVLADYPVFGEIVLKGEDRENVVAAWRAAVDLETAQRKKNRGAGGAGCFIPRHDLRFKYAGDTYDLLICFACGTTRFHKNGKEFSSVSQWNREDAYSKVFNDVLTKAKIEIAP